MDRDFTRMGDVDMEDEDVPPKKLNEKVIIIPLALRKSSSKDFIPISQAGPQAKIFHWKIMVSNEYPFKPPKVYNLNNVEHPDVDSQSGLLTVPCLTHSWSPVLTLKTIVYVLKLFILGSLEEFEPQEILFKGKFRLIDPF